MAEMTAEQAIEKLGDWIEYLSNTRVGSYKTVELEYADAQEIADLIQIQQQQIEAQAKQIELACSKLTKFRKCPPVVCDLSYHPGDAECVKHWQKWLEHQVKE